MSILLFIITFVFILIFLVLTIFGRFISGIFSLFRGNKSRQGGGYGGFYGRSQQSSDSYASQQQKESGKVFSKDEGEYVSYEEIE